ncbi:MAG: hypothetical protein JXR07_19945 [Reichenbachiella sp.]
MDIDRIKKLRDEFCKAENEIKQTESEFNELPLPPINELRYSFNHFLRTLTSEGEDEDNFRSAEKHVKRSIYDAVDVRIVSSLELLKYFKDDFKNIVISDVIPNWVEILGKARKIKNDLSSNDDGETRQERLEDHLRYAKELKEICDTCEDSREELKKLQKAEITKYRRFIIGILLAAIGVIVAAMAL